MSAEKKTYRECVEAALDAEKNARWTEAGELWDEARRASKTKATRADAAGKAAAAAVRASDRPPTISPAPPPVDGRGDVDPRMAADEPGDDGEFTPDDEARVDPRAARHGLVLGQVLEHERRGRVLAECTYVGLADWRYDGVSYTSISAAANAAAAALGMKSRTLNGWLFWGVEKRER